jgi:hypothetical protein
VATDGTVTDGPYPTSKAYVGGFAVVDVASREEALEWLPRSPTPAAVLKKSGVKGPSNGELQSTRVRQRMRITPEERIVRSF